MSTLSILVRGASIAGRGQAFLVAEDYQLTYGETLDFVWRLGRWIRDSAPVGNVAVLSPNDPLGYACSLAVHAAHRVFVPLNPSEPASVIEDAIERFDVSTVFYHPDCAARLEGVMANNPKSVCFLPIDRSEDGLGRFLQVGPAHPILPLPLLDSVASLVLTGGTTGKSKGVMTTHRVFVDTVQKFTCDTPQGPNSVVLYANPMCHGAGSLALIPMSAGGRVVFLRAMDLEKLGDQVAEHQATILLVPPTLLYRLLDMPAEARAKFASLERLITGMAPIAPSRLRQALEVFGPIVMQAYGQSEAHAWCVIMRPQDFYKDGVLGGDIADDERLTACGRPTVGTALRIVDDDGVDVVAGEPGEVWVHNGLIMTGYYNDPETTALTLTEGYVHTGDIGRIDADGFLHIVDRKKEMIISGGVNVYPAEIERVLGAYPAVSEVVAVGAPHGDWGEEVVAVVTILPGGAFSESAMIDFCKAALGSVKAPKRIEHWESLPRTAVGKVARKDVRARFWQQQSRAI